MKVFFTIYVIIFFISCNSASKENMDGAQETYSKPIIADSTYQASPQISISRDSISNYSYLLTLNNSLKLSSKATGCIIKYHDNYYLITAYHVLTGRDPITDKLLPGINETFTSVLIWFQPTSGNFFINKSFQLYNHNHQQLFLTIPASVGVTDLAVLPLPKSFLLTSDIRLYAIEETSIDSTDKNSDIGQVVIVGFPASKSASDYSHPTVYTGNLLSMAGKSRQANIYFDVNSKNGASGSPVYLYRNNSLKLAGVNSLGSHSELGLYENNDKVKGSASDIMYALRLVKIYDQYVINQK